MKRVLLAVTVSSLAACGGSAAEAPQTAEEAAALGYQCGACVWGSHPVGYRCDAACGGCGVFGDIPNSVDCEANTGSFGQCGLGCPLGYHVTGYTNNYNCGIPRTTLFNFTSCAINQGGAFKSCGRGCPSGYAPTGMGFNYNCRPDNAADLSENETSCQLACDATTPCQATLVQYGLVHYCRSMNGGPYRWMTPDQYNVYCNNSGQVCRSDARCSTTHTYCSNPDWAPHWGPPSSCGQAY